VLLNHASSVVSRLTTGVWKSRRAVQAGHYSKFRRVSKGVMTNGQTGFWENERQPGGSMLEL